MPGKRAGLLPLLLPSAVCIPVAAALTIVLVVTWQARDARAAAAARRTAAVQIVEDEIRQQVDRQSALTGQLSRSPLAWLWTKFQGQHLTASNRYHAETALTEMTRDVQALGATAVFYLASANTALVYRDGAPVRKLDRAHPQDDWYYTSTGSDSIALFVESGVLRLAARMMNEGALLGAVAVERPVADMVAPVLATLAGQGLSVSIVDAGGAVIASAAPSGLAPGARLLGTTAREPLFGTIVVSSAAPAGMPPVRLLLLVLIALACAALAVGGLAFIAVPRIKGTRLLFARSERFEDAARTAFTRVDASARSARSAAVNLKTAAAAIASEAAAGAASSGEAVALFARGEAADAELRAGIGGRLEVLADLADSIRASLAQSRAAQVALLSLGPDAATAEEQLGRIVALSASASGALERAAKGADALAEASAKLALLSVNASLEASRAGSAGQRLARLADDVRVVGEDAAARSKLLAGAVAEARTALSDARQAAQKAGTAVHAAAASAQGAGSAPADAWETTSALLAKVEHAGLSARALDGQAEASDRGRSALAGVEAIMGRVRALAAQAADLAASVAADAEGAARVSAAAMAGRDEVGAGR